MWRFSVYRIEGDRFNRLGIATFFIWWHCASDAEKKIFEEVVMTKKTIEVKSIYTDRFVEWLILDMQKVVGRCFCAGSDNLMRRHAVLLNAKNKLLHAFRMKLAHPKVNAHLLLS